MKKEKTQRVQCPVNIVDDILAGDLRLVCAKQDSVLSNIMKLAYEGEHSSSGC